MHKYERMALWAIVLLTLVLVLSRPGTSGFIGLKTSLFDVAEFKEFPPVVMTSIKESVLIVANAIGKKLTEKYNSMKEADRTEAAKKMKDGAEMLATKIKNDTSPGQMFGSFFQQGGMMMGPQQPGVMMGQGLVQQPGMVQTTVTAPVTAPVDLAAPTGKSTYAAYGMY